MLDLITSQIVQIPSLKSSQDSVAADCPCGIHSIATNPSRTMLATGAIHTNDLAIYRLPTFDPVCIGEVGVTSKSGVEVFVIQQNLCLNSSTFCVTII